MLYPVVVPDIVIRARPGRYKNINIKSESQRSQKNECFASYKNKIKSVYISLTEYRYHRGCMMYLEDMLPSIYKFERGKIILHVCLISHGKIYIKREIHKYYILQMGTGTVV